MKSEDMLEQLMKTLAGDYPELMRTILDERDLYLARSIWEVCGFSSCDYSHSSCFNECKKADESDICVRNRKLEPANGESVTSEFHHENMNVEDPATSPTTEKLSPSPLPSLSVPTSAYESDDSSLHCCPEWPGTDVLPRVVVAVVGIGHVAGIKRAWHRAAGIDKEKLCRYLLPTLGIFY